MKLPPEIQGKNVVILGKNRPSSVSNMDGCKGAVSSLEKLIVAMKGGFVPPPDVMYVAMHSHDTEGEKALHHLYTKDEKPDLIRVLGLLELHKQKHV